MQNELTYKWKTVGHEQVKHLLDLQVKNNSVAQSYLFLGPEGVGKRLLAKEFASRLATASADVLEFDFATQGVEDLRELLQRISLRPASGGRQIAVCNGAEHMQLATSNALLKSLEEPSASTVFILVSNRTNVAATIVSRCQNIQFGRLSDSELQTVAEELGVGANEDTVRALHGIPSRLSVVAPKQGQETKFAQWERELAELLSGPLLSRVVRSSALASEEVSDLEDRIRYWLEYFMRSTEEPKQLSRRLKILQESFTRLQKNGNRKLVMEYLCLNL